MEVRRSPAWLKGAARMSGEGGVGMRLIRLARRQARESAQQEMKDA